MLLLGLLECPRLTALVLLGFGVELGDAVPVLQNSSRVVESLRAAVREATHRGAWARTAAWVLCPWLEAVVSLLSLASDSFWWVFAFAHAGALSLWTDFALFRRIVLGRPLAFCVRSELLMTMVLVVPSIALVLAADALGVPVRSHSAGVLLRIACIRHALRGSTLPVRLLAQAGQRAGGCQRARLRAAAVCACALFFALCSLSSNLRFDLCSGLLMLGPGALLRMWVGEAMPSDVYVHMQIDRTRLLDSSVEALSSLPPAALRHGIPAVAYIRETGSGRASGGRSSEPTEDGIDAGGMRRDWLNRFIVEAFDPVNGLVDTATVDGRAYARLKQGASTAKLEAVGKAVGLALRAGQPLGVDLCAPLAHLLAHRRLPQALESVSAGLGGAAAPAASGGAPPPPGRRSAGWERLQLRFAARGRAVMRLKAAAEQVLLGFSREWLRWVSPEEHAYWSRCLSEDLPAADRAGLVEAAGAVTVDGAAVTLENLPEHMARRALDELLLDVREETLALWRGLHSIPGAENKVPCLTRETKNSKRLRQCVEDEEEERLRKRLRTADSSQAPASCQQRAPPSLAAASPAASASAAAPGGLGSPGDSWSPAAAPRASAPPPPGPGAAAEPPSQGSTPAAAAGAAASASAAAPSDLGSPPGELGANAAAPRASAPPPRGPGAASSSRSSASAPLLSADWGRPPGAPAPAGREGGPPPESPQAKRRRLDAIAFEPSPLQRRIAGDPEVPVERWMGLTVVELDNEALAKEGSETLEWFWAHAAALSAEERAGLLEWITGFQRLPPGGFPPPHRKMTIRLTSSAESLPVAHTCTLQLDLPARYGSAQTLHRKLSQAVEQRHFHLA